VLLNFSLSGRSVTRKTGQLQDITGVWTRYNLSAEYIFQPIPLTLGLDLGFQQLKWIHEAVREPPTYNYHAVYMGLRASYKINSDMGLYLKTEMPVYPADYFIVPNAPALIQGTLGFVWTIR
jgi:hypothetical protein